MEKNLITLAGNLFLYSITDKLSGKTNCEAVVSHWKPDLHFSRSSDNLDPNNFIDWFKRVTDKWKQLYMKVFYICW